MLQPVTCHDLNDMADSKQEKTKPKSKPLTLQHYQVPGYLSMADLNIGLKVGNLSDANFPKDAEGRVYHLGVKRGEVANRILSVGDPRRAQLIANMLDHPEKNFVRRSNRGFQIFTGTKNGVPVSVIATGMGLAMMDFVVRESRAIVDGPMLMIRLGTCGTVQSDVKIGTMAVASKGSVLIQRNPDAFENPDEHKSVFDLYKVSKPIPADPELSALLIEKLKTHVKTGGVVEGLNATADSFYSSQVTKSAGRMDSSFKDKNEDLIDELRKKFPELCTLEMESFHLLDMARVGKDIRATATTIILAQRTSNDFLSHETLHKLEAEAGNACLETLTNFPLDEKLLTKGPECVWNQP